jgi:hypothetical protein
MPKQNSINFNNNLMKNLLFLISIYIIFLIYKHIKINIILGDI